MSFLIAGIQRLSDGLDYSMRGLTILTTGAFTIIVFVSVLTRYVFSYPILWSQEVSKLLFIWSAFLAATIAFKKKSHIRFEFLNQVLGPKGTALTDTILYASSLLLFAVLFFQGIKFARIVWPTILPVLTFSQGWLYVSVIVTSVVFWIHSLRLLIESIQNLKAALSGTGEGEK